MALSSFALYIWHLAHGSKGLWSWTAKRGGKGSSKARATKIRNSAGISQWQVPFLLKAKRQKMPSTNIYSFREIISPFSIQLAFHLHALPKIQRASQSRQYLPDHSHSLCPIVYKKLSSATMSPQALLLSSALFLLGPVATCLPSMRSAPVQQGEELLFANHSLHQKMNPSIAHLRLLPSSQCHCT